MSLHDLRLPGLSLPNLGLSRLTNTLPGADPLQLNQQLNEIDNDDRDGSLRSRIARETGQDTATNPLERDGVPGFDGPDSFNAGAPDGWQTRSAYQPGTSPGQLAADPRGAEPAPASYTPASTHFVAPDVLGTLRDSLNTTLSRLSQLANPRSDVPTQPTTLGQALRAGADAVPAAQQTASSSLFGSTLPGADRALSTLTPTTPGLAREYAGGLPLSQPSPAVTPAPTLASLTSSALNQTASGSTIPTPGPLATASAQTASVQSAPPATVARQDAAAIPSARTGDTTAVPSRADALPTGVDRSTNVLSPSLQTQLNVAALAAARGAEALAPAALTQAAQTTPPGMTAVAQANTMANPMANVPLARGADAPVQLPGVGLPAGHTVEGPQRRRDQRMSAMDRMASALQLLRLRRRNDYADRPFRQPDQRNSGTQWLMWIVVVLAYGMLAAGVAMFVPADGHRDWVDFVTQSPAQGMTLAILGLIAVVGTVLLATRSRFMRRHR